MKITNQSVPVCCGKCPACYARRVSGWSFRLMLEEKVSKSAHFITLTYDTSNVPITRNGFMEIRKRDVQLFFKRLRKSHGVNLEYPLKYFVVGEYGGKSFRPHYHAIVFNCRVELIQPAWALGHVHYGTVTGASVGYTLKYMSKKGKIPVHKNDDRQPEFALMSKRLGFKYVTPEMVKWHLEGRRMYCVVDGNKKISMPRYFKEKVFTKEERKAFGLEAREKMLQKQDENPVSYRDLSEAHMAAFRRMDLNSTKGEKL